MREKVYRLVQAASTHEDAHVRPGGGRRGRIRRLNRDGADGRLLRDHRRG